MAYSRWGGRGSGHWYTFWLWQDGETENRDTAVLDICGVVSFTAKELRDDLSKCLAEVKAIDSIGDLEELEIYISEFLQDVDKEYPI